MSTNRKLTACIQYTTQYLNTTNTKHENLLIMVMMYIVSVCVLQNVKASAKIFSP